MNQDDLNIAKTEAYNQPPPTPNSATNQPSVETIAAPANFAVNISGTKARLPETNIPDSPMTQGNFMPQSLMDKPKKKSSKLFWLIPVFGYLFLTLGGAGFGIYLWQKNRAAITADTNSTVANSSE